MNTGMSADVEQTGGVLAFGIRSLALSLGVVAGTAVTIGRSVSSLAASALAGISATGSAVGAQVTTDGRSILDQTLAVVMVRVKHSVAVVISEVISEVIAELDLTAIVLDNVDVDALVASVDVEAIIDRIGFDEIIAKRVDVDAILDRVDMIGLAENIVDGVGLPGLIREASTSVTADVVADVRTTSERADDAVAALVGRLLRRSPGGALDV